MTKNKGGCMSVKKVTEIDLIRVKASVSSQLISMHEIMIKSSAKSELKAEFPELVVLGYAMQRDSDDPLGVIAKWCFRYFEMLLLAVDDEKYRELLTEEDTLSFAAGLPYELYLKTPHWKRIRDEALERAEHRCQMCNRGGVLDVHHRTYERLGAEHPMDVFVLCRGCHTAFHRDRRVATAWPGTPTWDSDFSDTREKFWNDILETERRYKSYFRSSHQDEEL